MNRKLYFTIKRLFDICASGIVLIVLSPVFLIAIIGILISDFGPVFYAAERVGKNNNLFKMYKFRSMRVDKKANEKSLRADVNRIFPWGAFMRKSKIDELPQLLNVFLGDMSVVGPRPAAKDQVEITRAGKYAIASTVKPGLTGPAALYDYIYGDDITDEDEYKKKVLPTRLELEAYYPAHMSIAYDIKMIWYTVVCIFSVVLGKENPKILKELTSIVDNRVRKEL